MKGMRFNCACICESKTGAAVGAPEMQTDSCSGTLPRLTTRELKFNLKGSKIIRMNNSQSPI
jgi:hypothetical protein